MKLHLARRDKGLSLLGAIIIFSAVVALGYILLKILMRCADMIPPPVYLNPPDTNNITRVTSQQFDSIVAVETIVMPTFVFPEDIISVVSITDESTILIERSTNMTDWTPSWRMKLTDSFNFGHDTNNSPWCFYRMKLE